MENFRIFKRDYKPNRTVYKANDKNKNETPAKSLEGWILFVTNLHEETTEEDLRVAFGDYGKVMNVHLNLDRRTGFVKGYALIEFDAYANASAARECMNNSDLLGVRIKVNWCFTENKI